MWRSELEEVEGKKEKNKETLWQKEAKDRKETEMGGAEIVKGRDWGGNGQIMQGVVSFAEEFYSTPKSFESLRNI